MSNQGHEGWFPECLICGMGNLNGIVCLEPMRHEQFDVQPIRVTDVNLIERDGHWWMCCQICNRPVHADPVAWGSYAFCIGCFNAYVERGEYPPTSPSELCRDKHVALVNNT